MQEDVQISHEKMTIHIQKVKPEKSSGPDNVMSRDISIPGNSLNEGLVLAAPPSDIPVAGSGHKHKIYSGVSKLVGDIITTMTSHTQNVVLFRVPILTNILFSFQAINR